MDTPTNYADTCEMALDKTIELPPNLYLLFS